MPFLLYSDMLDFDKISPRKGKSSKKEEINSTNDFPKKNLIEKPNELKTNSVPELDKLPSYSKYHHNARTSNRRHYKARNFHLNRRRMQRLDRRLKRIEDQMNAKRIFDKLEVNSNPPVNPDNRRDSTSSSSSFASLNNEVILLELDPEFLRRTERRNISDPLTPTWTSSASLNFDDSFVFKDSGVHLNDGTTESFALNDELEQVNDSFSVFSCNENKPNLNGDVASDCVDKQDESKRVHTCPDEIHCELFRNGYCFNEKLEIREMVNWYDHLIQWRHDVVMKRCFRPPFCPPPPLTVALINASRAPRINPFQLFDGIHPFRTMFTLYDNVVDQRPQRLVPHVLPLPPPHHFIEKAKSMEPHKFVEYCYQLTAGAYIDAGMNPPHRAPPIPPRVNSMPCEEKRIEYVESSDEVSSSGEYSDDLEDQSYYNAAFSKTKLANREVFDMSDDEE